VKVLATVQLGLILALYNGARHCQSSLVASVLPLTETSQTNPAALEMRTVDYKQTLLKGLSE